MQLSNKTEKKYGKSIILPIKPIYAEKIFSGEKKYEFRKRLCIENIDKIYLYATSPIKKIVGEAVVCGKYSMKKEELWKLASEYSGITTVLFDQYFQKADRANAYKLGEVIRYRIPVELKEMGVSYAPQSYVYVDTI